MKTLLAAVDLSDASPKVVNHARDLAKSLGARIVFVHVIEPIATYVPVGAAMDVIETAPPPVIEASTEAQEKRLETFAEHARGDGLDADAVVTIGLAAEEIVGAAETHNASYVILGSHGHGALYNLFAGSVVTGVLKRSTCPVIIVPIPHR